VVPGSASGAGGGAATLGVDGSTQLTPLTVDFHEPGFVATANGENAFRAQKGFWFQLSGDDRQQAKSPWGPANPQALNRYSYVLNNPVRYVDPTGHYPCYEVCWRFWRSVFQSVTEFVVRLLGGRVITYGQKIAKQMPKRGWSDKDIKDVISNPAKTTKWSDYKTGDSVTYYYGRDGHYVVVNDRTNEIIQVSDRLDPGWIDPTTNLPIDPVP
jgi:RHS repeat-associated protein